MASYKMPSFVGRALGFLLPSNRMYKMANALPSVFKKSEILLQDFMIPFPNIAEFVYRLNNYLGVWPLWFCPLKVIIAAIHEPCFSIPCLLSLILTLWPLWFCPLKNFGAPGPIFGVPTSLGDYCNVGAYGIPRQKIFLKRQCPSNFVLQSHYILKFQNFYLDGRFLSLQRTISTHKCKCLFPLYILTFFFGFLPRRKVFDFEEDNKHMEMLILFFPILNCFSCILTFFAFYSDVRFLTLRRITSTWKCKCSSLMGAR